MPHLVYSEEEIESCLHFILLQDENDTGSSSTNSCWWPCLVLENMSMLHGVCQQKNYMQTPAAESERRAAYMDRCLVDGRGGAATRQVVLLLGPSPPAPSRFWFRDSNNNAQQPWTLRPMLDGAGSSAIDECTTFLQQEDHHHHGDDHCFDFLQAFGEAKLFITYSEAPPDGADDGTGIVYVPGNRKVAVVEP